MIMGKKKKATKKIINQVLDINYNEMDKVQENFNELIETDPQYSLQIDPTNKYHFTQDEKDFIQLSIQYKSAKIVTEALGIDYKEYALMNARFPIREEIKRINKVIYQYQFSNKMLNLDQVGGYLTSLLTDDFVPLDDRLKTKDKVQVAKMIADINKLKMDAMNKPTVLEPIEIEEKLEKLSVASIKQLLISNANPSKELSEKNAIIDQINEDKLLTAEEIAVLRNSSLTELMEMLDEITKAKKKDEQK